MEGFFWGEAWIYFAYYDMDGIGDGSYGWWVDDVGGMEDIDGKFGI